ncbi:MAG: hypothetical protein LBF63_05000, partial [Treponema sp.]|nr:hypothetical protein [Treponema sp.]
MKNYLRFACLVISAAVMVALSACPPVDGVDLEAGPTGGDDDGIEYVEVKRIVFDDLSTFTVTANPPSDGVINDYQLGGGGDTAPTVELSAEQNHTSGEAGKSLKWSGRTLKYQRIKFDRIFGAEDVGRMFKISVWVYTDTATTVQLGTYRVSGANVGDATTAVDTETFVISVGWNELVWNGYEHTEPSVTQLAIEQPNSADVSLAAVFYLDDIVIKASGVSDNDTDGFVAVSNITAVPTLATAGVDLSLSGTVNPTNATNNTIAWSIAPDNALTGTTVEDGVLKTTTTGTAKVRATIANGSSESTDYTQDFEITV